MVAVALITGISGFVGSHLAEFLLGKDLEVYGTIRWRSRTENIEHIRDKLHLIEADIRDAHSMQNAIDETLPDYIFAVTKCEYGEVYNICSEKARTIQSVLDLLLSMTNKDIEVKQDPSRMRPSDVEILLGDCSKFKEKTGWKPEIPFEKTIEDLLNWWRDSLGV